MSKEAAMRAMREARYRERLAAPTAAASSKPTKPVKKQASPAPAPAASADGLCEHRSMNGRTCSREHGHTAKSHRYS